MTITVVELDWMSIICHSSAFVSAVALFQYGANTFTHHAAILAGRAGIPEVVVSLIPTTSAELEELSIILASLIQKKPALGLGHIIGSTISNVLGAFSLVLLFHKGRLKFDRGAKVFATVSFVMTTLFNLLTWQNKMGIEEGISLLVAFSVYIFCLASAIYEGMIKSLNLINSRVNIYYPQNDNDSTTEEESNGFSPAYDEEEIVSLFEERASQDQFKISIFPTVMRCNATETSPLLLNESNEVDFSLQSVPSSLVPRNFPGKIFIHHATRVLIGSLALILSGLVATYSVAAIATALDLSNFIAGLTILSFAVPLPERLIKFSYNRRLPPGVLMASTAGTNIILITLCMGIILVALDKNGKNNFDGDMISFELWACWGCSFLLLIITWFGGRPYEGAFLLVLYCVYLGCELTVFRR
ncbi:putative sodium calcium transporter [Erysiphe necator]|uniref:Putative sodium calcium transporter n=1 Tax=Uncinula necator TaxID=52586 RepID=A0A0B1PC82_UNCNE|nr:putative sodium calcium transporter [Erysiphe necator]